MSYCLRHRRSQLLPAAQLSGYLSARALLPYSRLLAYTLFCSQTAGRPKHIALPPAALATVSLCGQLYPCSDFRHPVLTPCDARLEQPPGPSPAAIPLEPRGVGQPSHW